MTGTSRTDEMMEAKAKKISMNGIYDVSLVGKRVNVYSEKFSVHNIIFTGRKMVKEFPNAADILEFDKGNGEYLYIREEDIVAIEVMENGVMAEEKTDTMLYKW